MIVFTICSNNYLGYARALAGSIEENCDISEFIIFICDVKRPDIDYESIHGCRLVFPAELGIAGWADMVERYTTVELNTSIKPFAFDWCFENYEDDYVCFLDPDVYVLADLSCCVEEIGDRNLLLTPHIYNPIPLDGFFPKEDLFNQYGLYNLGFLIVRRSAESHKFLGWWSEHTRCNCYARAREGVFVDQLPINLATIFFKGVVISQNRGLNVAPWNNHEREVVSYDETYYLADGAPLVFYHFSNYEKHNHSGATHPSYNRCPVGDHPVLVELYREYSAKLIENNWDFYRSFKPGLGLILQSSGADMGFKSIFRWFSGY